MRFRNERDAERHKRRLLALSLLEKNRKVLDVIRTGESGSMTQGVLYSHTTLNIISDLFANLFLAKNSSAGA